MRSTIVLYGRDNDTVPWCSAGVGCKVRRAAWRLGSGVDEVGMWIAKVVLVINLVVRSEKKVAEG